MSLFVCLLFYLQLENIMLRSRRCYSCEVSYEGLQVFKSMHGIAAYEYRVTFTLPWISDFVVSSKGSSIKIRYSYSLCIPKKQRSPLNFNQNFIRLKLWFTSQILSAKYLITTLLYKLSNVVQLLPYKIYPIDIISYHVLKC